MSKALTSRLYSLDIRWIYRHRPPNKGSGNKTEKSRQGNSKSASFKALIRRNSVSLKWRTINSDGITESIHQMIYVTWTPCHLGGKRPWFKCAACGGRVAILYHADRFYCRHCLNLAYPSENETPLDRSLRRVREMKSVINPGLSDVFRDVPRPKGMHWSTYFKRLEKIEVASRIMLDLFAWELGLPSRMIK
jgi:hypothetical protein